MMPAEPLPPHSVAAEEAIIGSLLIDHTVMRRIGTLVQPQDFFREQNRWAYEAALRIAARDEPTGPVSMAYELGQGDKLETVGNMAYISRIIARTPTSVHAEYYAKLVHDLAERRRAISAGAKMVRDAYAGSLVPVPTRRPKHGPVDV